MKFAICNETYQGWTIEKTCEHAASCGYEGLEIAPFTLSDDPNSIDEARAEAIGKTARDAGVPVIGLHWLLLKPEGLHFTTPDDGTRERTVAFLEHLTRLCAAMGGSILVFGSPKQRNVVDGDAYDEAFRRAVDGCRRVCEVAEPLGVTLALEPLGGAETTFLKTAAEGVRLIEAVDRPACRLHLDVKAMCSEDAPAGEIIRAHAAHLAHFHANDANLRGPGFGDVDFAPIAAALKDARYEGYVSVEVFDYSPDPETIASKSIEYLKKTFAEAGAI